MDSREMVPTHDKVVHRWNKFQIDMNFSPDLYSDLPTSNTSLGRPPFHDEIIAVSNTPPFGPGIRYTWQVLWIHGFSRWISSISRRATEWTASTTDSTTHDEFSLQSIWTDGFVASCVGTSNTIKCLLHVTISVSNAFSISIYLYQTPPTPPAVSFSHDCN